MTDNPSQVKAGRLLQIEALLLSHPEGMITGGNCQAPESPPFHGPAESVKHFRADLYGRPPVLH